MFPCTYMLNLEKENKEYGEKVTLIYNIISIPVCKPTP